MGTTPWGPYYSSDMFRSSLAYRRDVNLWLQYLLLITYRVLSALVNAVSLTRLPFTPGTSCRHELKGVHVCGSLRLGGALCHPVSDCY